MFYKILLLWLWRGGLFHASNVAINFFCFKWLFHSRWQQWNWKLEQRWQGIWSKMLGKILKPFLCLSKLFMHNLVNRKFPCPIHMGCANPSWGQSEFPKVGPTRTKISTLLLTRRRGTNIEKQRIIMSKAEFWDFYNVIDCVNTLCLIYWCVY